MSDRLIILAVVLILGAAGYMLIDVKGPPSFIYPYRATKLAAMIVVGAALSVATVLFQTITGNRILTPSLLGFDALYVFVLTLLVYGLGGAGYAAMSAGALFALNLGAMAVLGVVLFTMLMRMARGDMVRMVLAGIVMGLLIRAMTGFLQRLIDPSEAQIIQASSFARFTRIDGALLGVTGAAVAVGLVMAWRLRHRLDVLTLGSDTATSLGEPPARLHRRVLMLVILLVAASTALAGPMAAGSFGPASFFGLLVAAFAHIITPTHRHAILMPAAALTGAIVLVCGQFIMERLLHLATPLIVVIEIAGGVTFLVLLLKRRAT